MDTEDEIALALRAHYLFTKLSEADFAELVSKTRPVELQQGQLLFSRNDAAERFFLVTAGQIKLFRTTPEGQEKVVEIIKPEQTFAEAVMFMEEQRYPVSAQALQATHLLAIPCRTYLSLLRDNPQGCLRLLGDLSIRLHRRLIEIEDLTLQNATHRVVRYLLRQLPDNAVSGTVLKLDAPKQDIASKLVIKPETFSRILRSLTDDGLISVKGRNIAMLDLNRLNAASP